MNKLRKLEINNTFLSLVEALIFAAPEPIDEHAIADLIQEINSDDIPELVERLNQVYDANHHAFRIISGAGGYRFATLPEFGTWVKRLVIGSGRIRLSRASLETISIIAYRQPISRAGIENIRGVDVSGVLRLLLDRKLIKVKGKSPGAGRALLYQTTSEFLSHFGLNSLDDLPAMEEWVDRAEAARIGETDMQKDMDFNENADSDSPDEEITSDSATGELNGN